MHGCDSTVPASEDIMWLTWDVPHKIRSWTFPSMYHWGITSLCRGFGDVSMFSVFVAERKETTYIRPPRILTASRAPNLLQRCVSHIVLPKDPSWNLPRQTPQEDIRHNSLCNNRRLLNPETRFSAAMLSIMLASCGQSVQENALPKDHPLHVHAYSPATPDNTLQLKIKTFRSSIWKQSPRNKIEAIVNNTCSIMSHYLKIYYKDIV